MNSMSFFYVTYRIVKSAYKKGCLYMVCFILYFVCNIHPGLCLICYTTVLMCHIMYISYYKCNIENTSYIYIYMYMYILHNIWRFLLFVISYMSYTSSVR